MRKIGVGYGAIFYGTGYGNGFPDESRATAELRVDDSVAVYVEVSDVGSGGLSVMTQIAIETLGLPHDRISIINNDTLVMKDSGTAAASRQTYNTGNAVMDACKQLKELIDSVDKTLPLYWQFVDNNLPLKTEGYFKATTSSVDLNTGQGDPYWPYTFGVEKVKIAVDDETGKVDILEATTVFDGGKIVNPVLAKGQSIGGTAMGIGYAIMEEVVVKEGSIENRNFSDYIIPTSLDVPEVDCYFVEEQEETGPFGAKGIGEPVMLPTAPAIINAIYDAVGVRIYDMPATCEKVLEAINKNKGK